MIIKSSKALFLVLIIFSVIPSISFASLIDFRTDEPFKTDQPNNQTIYSATIGSLIIDFIPSGPVETPLLYWDSTDGFGVQAGSYEADEVEYPEMLEIHFSEKVYISDFYLTNLFFEHGYEEIGSWSIDQENWNSFSQTDHSVILGSTNGDYTLGINLELDTIWFDALGKQIIGQNHEFSVGGVKISAPVPEPTTILLLGAGLLGFAVAGRKKFFKNI